jgi:hypothetical protein
LISYGSPGSTAFQRMDFLRDWLNESAGLNA